MHTYNQYKNSELTVAGVGEMVRTIEKIAASRLHGMTGEMRRIESYAGELALVLSYISQTGDHIPHPLTVVRDRGISVLILLGGNKGLVGGMNNALMGWYRDHKPEYQRIIAVGRRIKMLMDDERIVPDMYFDGSDEDLDSGSVSKVSEYLTATYSKDQWRRADVLYPRHVSFSVQEPFITAFLPFQFDQSGEAHFHESGMPAGLLPLYEPSRSKVYERFLELYIRVRFYMFMYEAKLSELSARTIEMENAASKADAMLSKIRHDFAKERRSNSTLKQLSSFQVSRMP